MSARIEDVLAEHFSPDRCVVRGHFSVEVPFVEAYCAHLAAALRDAGVITRDEAAAAWDDGYDAGHRDARAVGDHYPDPTPNPFRAGGDQ